MNLLDSAAETGILVFSRVAAQLVEPNRWSSYRKINNLHRGESAVQDTVLETVTRKATLEAIRKRNILDRIKQGEWDCEPESVDDWLFDATIAMPGTDEKLSVLAARVEAGLPLWHGHDRMEYDEEG